MDYLGRTTTTVSAPATGPMDLNEAGRPNWRELAPLFGVMMLALVPVGIGGAIVVAVWPRSEYDLSGWRVFGLLMGGLLVFGGGSWFWTLKSIVPRSIQRYHERVDDWHYAQLEKYQESDGRVLAQQVSEWHLTTHDARHMLLLLLYVYLTGKAPSIRQLTDGPLLVKAGHRAFSLGAMTQDAAAEALNLFARAGLLIDRQPKQAGRLAVMDFKTAAHKVLVELSHDPRVVDGAAMEE
jgi:hypothetical protein